MKQKLNRFKRILIASMAAVCVVSTAAVIGASATSESCSYTIDCAALESTSMEVSSTKAGTLTDTFNSYPTIYDGKSTSTVKTYVQNKNYNTKTSTYTTTLQKDNPSHPSVNYGSVKAGKNWHYFYVADGGGFKDTVTTRNRY